MDYKSQILAVRPHLKQNSAEAYATSLKLLAPAENDDLDFLLDTTARVRGGSIAPVCKWRIILRFAQISLSFT